MTEPPPMILGDFELLAELGRGAMGIVYEARQISLSRKVALKVLRKRDRTEQGIERFRREMEAASKLAHPGIVPLWAIGEDEHHLYYAMQLVRGPTLREVIYKDTFAHDKAARVAMGIAEALHHAHRRGVIHRDIKPNNILINQEGKPLLTDFGLAKDVRGQPLTKAGMMLGTPTHMAPEQVVKGGEVDHRSDIYGLGVCLYEMLVQRLPFYSENLRGLLDAITQDEVPPPSSIVRNVPRPLEIITLKCLAREKDERFDSAADVAAELDRYLRGHALLTKPPSPGRRLGVWVGRNRVVSLLVFGSVLAAVVVGGVAVQQAAAMRQASGVLRASSERAEQRGDVEAALFAVAAMLELNPANGYAKEQHAALLQRVEERRLADRQQQSQELAAAEFASGKAAEEHSKTLRDSVRERAEDQALLHYGLAIKADPGHAEAKAARGRIYLGRGLRAERAGRSAMAELYFELVRQHNPQGIYDAALNPTGTLSVRVGQPGAVALLSRMTLGHTSWPISEADAVVEALPLHKRTLPLGSYLLVISAKGFASAVTVVRMERQRETTLTPQLLEPSSIPPGFVYIPAGPVFVGGDEQAPRSLPYQRCEVAGFLMAEHEVSVEAYKQFLDTLAMKQAVAYLPHAGADRRYAALFWPDAKAGWQYPASWSPQRPVCGVSYRAAEAFALWFGQQLGRKVRMPSEIEWEKAGRGADARPYAWGALGWERLAVVAQSPVPTNVPTADRSVYGVAHMTGNVAEWTSGVYAERANKTHRVVRGGSFAASADLPRLAARFPTPIDSTPAHVGIRLVCDLE